MRLELKKPWTDGTSAFAMEPLDFIARLVAAILPPRFHMIRFHGVLAPHSALRSLVVPKPRPVIELEAVLQLPLFVDATVAQKHAPLDAERKRACVPRSSSVGAALAARVRGRRDRVRALPRSHALA